MHRIFGRAKPAAPEGPPPPTLGEHLTKLEGRLPELDAKIAECDKQLVALKQQIARTRPAGQGPLKQKALTVLKRRKMYEQQRDGMQARAFNLEQTTFAIDAATEAKDHVAIMKQSTAALKTAHAEIDVGEIEDLQDDMIDMIADSNEINEIMTRSYDAYSGVDEGTLDAELAALDDGSLAMDASDLVVDDALAGPAAAAPAAGAGAAVPANGPAVPTGLPAPAVPAGMPASGGAGRAAAYASTTGRG